MPSSWRERVDMASAISGILDSYPGNSILREILQNSDDAGATKQTFILDCRQHGDQSVIENVLKRTQGPSLLAVNDSMFTESDWEAVRTIHGSNKSADETKTGKYGLGIRACYHITDNIHILSGDKLVIFDPHGEFDEFEGGVSISIKDEMNRFQDQTDAFRGALTEVPFEGTVVRLPLRTHAEAQRSRIKPVETRIDHIRSLFHGFIENELPVALLFLKHVMFIELREIGVDGSMTVKATVTVSNPEVAPLRSFVPGNVCRSETYRLDIVSTVGSDRSVVHKWRIVHVVDDEASVQSKISQRLGYNVDDRLKQDKLSSHIALAFPLSHQHVKGQLFTLLPLPIWTGFPLHVHGVFALTSDRQHLRNPNELGIEDESRERLLVFWNRMIFEDFLPMAWSLLLRILVKEEHVEDIWSAWPLENSSLAPASLALVMNTVLENCEEVFPALIQGRCTFIGSGQTALAAAASFDRELVHAVSMAGVSVVTPPSPIFIAFERSDFRSKQQGCLYSFDGHNLHSLLRPRIPQLGNLGNPDKDRILEYLISSSPSYIVELPLILTVGGDRISLSAPNVVSTRYILATAAEAELFRSYDANIIDISALPNIARDKLAQSFSRDYLNVTDFSPEIMENYLRRVCLSSSPSVSWCCAFWNWMDSLSLPDSHPFFVVASSFCLLPMLDDTLRQVSKKAFLSSPVQEELLKMLRDANVPFLHPSLTSTGTLTIHAMALSIENVPELVGFINPDIPKHEDRLILQNHLTQCLQVKPALNRQQQMDFCRLPIFPTRIPSVPSPKTELNTATGRCLQFVNVADDFPLPILEDITFMDVSKTSSVLLQVLEPLSSVLREVEILNLAAENISNQPESLQDLLLRRIIPWLMLLTQEAREKLRHQKCIPTAHSRILACPADIIDPHSSIAGLYEDETDRFPADPYSETSNLSMMQSANLLRTQLSSEMLDERIKHISHAPADAVRFEKARRLLDLLSEEWDPSYAQKLQTDDQTSWIPTDHGTLAPRQQCRDLQPDEHQFLFDEVLSIVARPISGHMRKALGWGIPLEFEILEQQFQATLDRPDISHRSGRLLRLIQYLAKQYSKGALASANLCVLQDMVRDREWIPLSHSSIASTRYTLLADAQIGRSFHCIPLELQERSYVDFLKAMGCRERPTVDILIETLAEVFSKPDSVSEMQLLLSELSLQGEEISDDQRERILVLDQDVAVRKLSEVYFNDLGSDSTFVTLKDDLFAAHPAISRMVAERLRIPSLSSLRLDDEDDLDIDDEDISESLVTRIRKTLVEYDIQYSLNEFLANASDAKACQFEILLDTKPCNSTRILCPQMSVFQQGPALVLFNDTIFSDNDFRGVRNIGEGGKQDSSGTIGKFGLGALSFYHFSEVAFIVSGEYIMILDPSASYLPKRRGQIMRRSIWRKLKNFRRTYDGHLAPLHGINGFSMDMDEYRGTLIRLPLRGSAAGSPSRLSNNAMSLSRCRELIMGSYHELAQSALFFTSLRLIVAQERLGDETVKLWSVAAAKIQTASGGVVPEKSVFSYSVNESSQRRWLVITDCVPMDQVPVEFHPVVEQLKADAGIEISLAFCLDSDSGVQYHLFSGLRLPEVLSMIPAHLNSAFAVSSDRRGIRFDPPDGNGRRTLQSEYNMWLLSQAFPPLYLRGLESILSKLQKRKGTHWWPKKANKGPISEALSNAFYTLLPTTDYAIFPTVTGELICPKDALVSSKEPVHIRELLTFLKVSRFVTLGSATSYLPDSGFSILDAESLVNILKQADVEQRLYELFSHRRDSHTKQLEGRPTEATEATELMKLISMIDSTLCFILEAKLTTGYNLPLLVTEDLILRRFNDGDPIYFSESVSSFPDGLFPKSRFLSNFISRETAQLLIASPSYGVQDSDSQTALSFIQRCVGRPSSNARHSDETIAWINLFWKTFLKPSRLPFGLKLDHLYEYPLFATQDDQVFVSLASCHSGVVLPDPKVPELRALMNELDIFILREHPILSSDDRRLEFSFKKLLQCLFQNCRNPFTRLKGESADWLARWIVQRMMFGLGDLDSTHLDFLTTLPLWEAAKNGLIQRSSAKELRQLPSDIILSRISRFLDPEQSVAQHSRELESLWFALKDDRNRTSSRTDLSAMLSLPYCLSQDDIDDYKYLVEKLIDGRATSLKVPDGGLVLRSPEELFSSSQPLFRAAFHHSEQVMFVHPDFQDLQENLDVQRRVTIDVFLQCAQVIQQDLLRDQLDEILLRERATIVYDHYSNQLPREIMSDRDTWIILDDISFIPRGTAGLPGISYDPGPYFAQQYPAVVRPRDLLREKYWSIAWTQRCRFDIPPAQNLIAVYPDIGVPTAEDVVAHLRVLAIQVSRDHAHDPSLICHLNATYDWLQDNRSAAETVLRGHQNEPIFLNVADIDDPLEPWEWRSASQLVLNLAYDSGRFYTIQPFLHAFKDLLLATGARKRVDVTYEDEAVFGDEDFERLRASGKLLDIELRPDPEHLEEDESPNRLRLKAHAAYLAAHVPHIEDALTGWNEATERVLQFPGTYFGARAFLDIVYTGDIQAERTDNEEQAMELLKNLLEMLPVADSWDLPALRKKLGWFITTKYLFIQPETLDMIRREAEEHHATELAQACKDFAEKNADILDDFK
ncbi:hypothetical protein GYMLUDRAFT_219036 [Collybiopsis luxurians FD-317 M1]|nr:hypothetical protein GYMLUDRAFT_219036 [Collybiopsis luxurians FD-317 M1]